MTTLPPPSVLRLALDHCEGATAAEVGGFLRLVAYAWTQPDCGLPDDVSTLRRVSGLERHWYRIGRDLVRRFERRGKRLVLPWLLAARQEAERRADHARTAALVRWQRRR